MQPDGAPTVGAGDERRWLALLSAAEVREADRRAIAAGVSKQALVEAAGRAVAAAVLARWSPRPVAVLAGPGDNGSDGLVAARLLAAAGWPVRVGRLGPVRAESWSGPTEPLTPAVLAGAGLVVDAIFGTGLSRPLDGEAARAVAAIATARVPVVAVDLPSGLDATTGTVLGAAAPADVSVTFFRRRPGHVLMPGRALCGEVVVADIGIPDRVLDGMAVSAFLNAPGLWAGDFPRHAADTHKYRRGHLAVAGGAVFTGAARLAARAGARIGAGLVTVAAPPPAWPVYAASLTSIMAVPVDDAAFGPFLADQRRNAYILGPGGGVGPEMRRRVTAVLAAGRAAVLDADALSSFAGLAAELGDVARGRQAVLTPHDGEFRAVFGDVAGTRLDRARHTAALTGAVVVLKGPDTVIAAPEGTAAITANAPPTLATAGTGDVLAGMIGGLLAQGVAPFAAAAMACWMHGEAAAAFGPGLIAEDLPEALPKVLQDLEARLRRRSDLSRQFAEEGDATRLELTRMPDFR